MLIRSTSPAARAIRARRAAFTLMEVLVVVAILVVLASVGGVIYQQIQEDTYKDVAKSQITQLMTACESYQILRGAYPDTLAQLTQPVDGRRPYLEEKALIDPWRRQYQYQREGTRSSAGRPDIWSEGPKPGDQTSLIGSW